MTPIRTLLISGANNHDWRTSTPYLRDLLSASGRFTVTVTTDPATDLAAADLAQAYDLLFLDYNGPSWGEAASANFVAAVRGGVGVVVLHAANNAFPGFVEFEQICALCWREGTGHGPVHEFEVRVTAPDHPITRGLTTWRQTDELYHRLVPQHGTPYELLATAYSAPEQKGTGQDEPVLLTVQFGAGRVFHQVLGHIWPGDPQHIGSTLVALRSEGFRLTTLRGAEWAATGEVSIVTAPEV